MKSFTNFLIFLVSLAIAAHGSPLQQEIEARTDACTTKSMLATIATINSGVGAPLAFCNWYLTDGRTRSPINGLSVQSLESACVCLGGSKPATKAVASITMSPGAITTSCAAANVQLLKARFVDYKTFCKFYNAAPRDSSPLPALGPKGLWNACNCALGLSSTSISKSVVSTSSSSTPSTTSHSTSKVTSITSLHTTLSTTTSKPTSSAVSSTISKSSSGTTTSKSTYSSSSSSLSTTTKSSSSTSTVSSTSTTLTLPVLSTITSIIEAHHYQSFCSQFLSYTIPSETVTTTETFTAMETSTFTSPKTLLTTIIANATFTAVETNVSTSTTFVTEAVNTVTATETVTIGATATAVVDKRSTVEMQVPASLSGYESLLLSSACQIVVPTPTNTATTSVTASVTASVTTTETSASIETDITTITSTTTGITAVTTLEATTATVSVTSTITSIIPTATGLTGYLNFDNSDFWGFTGTPSIGSDLQTSTSALFTDEFTFSGSLTAGVYGYFVHTTTNLCLTLTAPAIASSSGTYNGGLVQLQTCGTTATAPENQNFVYRGGSTGHQCFWASADVLYTIMGPTGSNATDATVIPGGENGSYCWWISSST